MNIPYSVSRIPLGNQSTTTNIHNNLNLNKRCGWRRDELPSVDGDDGDDADYVLLLTRHSDWQRSLILSFVSLNAKEIFAIIVGTSDWRFSGCACCCYFLVTFYGGGLLFYSFIGLSCVCCCLLLLLLMIFVCLLYFITVIVIIVVSCCWLVYCCRRHTIAQNSTCQERY